MSTITSSRTIGAFFSVFAFIALLPSSVLAGPVIRSGDTVSIDAEQVLEGDFYGLGGTVTLSGAANADVYVAGGSVTINGDIQGDLTVLGGVVQVHGEVKDDVRVVGGEVLIAKPVGGDVVVVAGDLSVLSTATVSGDILLLGNKAVIEGDVQGSIYGASERVRINGHVGQNVTVRATQEFALGGNADIGGNVKYKSMTDMVRAQNAVVSGTVQKDGFIPNPSNAEAVEFIVFRILILLFATLALFLVARPMLKQFVSTTMEAYGKQGLIGFGVLVATPLIAILLLTSLIGMVVGISLLLLYFLSLIVSWVVASILLGALAIRVFKHERESVTLISVVLGTLLFGILPLVPLVGPLLMVMLSIVSLGGLSMALYKQFR